MAGAMGAGQIEGMTMYAVILIAEDGEYTLTGPMPESDALKWIEKNESSYGEDQRLALRWYGY